VTVTVGVPATALLAAAGVDALPASTSASAFKPGGCAMVNLSVMPSAGSCVAVRMA